MRRIIVVESESDLGKLICYYLNSAGYEVTLVKDGEAGLRAFEKQKPDLIVINEQLAQMTRYQFIAEVRASEDSASVPILAVVKGREPTGFVLRAGADAVLEVPESLEMLAPKVEELLSRKPSE